MAVNKKSNSESASPDLITLKRLKAFVALVEGTDEADTLDAQTASRLRADIATGLSIDKSLLFDKVGSSVQPTELTMLLVEQAKKAIDAVDEFKRTAANGLPSGRKIEVGICSPRLAPVIINLALNIAKARNIDVTFEFGSYKDLEERSSTQVIFCDQGFHAKYLSGTFEQIEDLGDARVRVWGPPTEGFPESLNGRDMFLPGRDSVITEKLKASLREKNIHPVYQTFCDDFSVLKSTASRVAGYFADGSDVTHEKVYLVGSSKPDEEEEAFLRSEFPEEFPADVDIGEYDWTQERQMIDVVGDCAGAKIPRRAMLKKTKFDSHKQFFNQLVEQFRKECPPDSMEELPVPDLPENLKSQIKGSKP